MLYAPPITPITGTIPGKLDPNQPSRVLHGPGSILVFAIFSPFAARNPAASDANSLNSANSRGELCRNKRIVIEITASGDSFWRWVPRAIIEDGVADEGVWPREVRYCGERVVLSQDQWDIHKLDPAFECRIPLPPGVPEINVRNPQPHAPPLETGVPNNFTVPSLVQQAPQGIQPPVMAASREPTPPLTSSKRPKPGSSSSNSSESLRTPPHKRPRAATVEENDSDESDDDMPIDARTPDYGPSSDTFDFANACANEEQEEEEGEEEERILKSRGSRKRKVTPSQSGIRHREEEPIVRPSRLHRNETFYKRSRTASPDFIRHEINRLGVKLARAAHIREMRHRQRKDARNQAFHEKFMESMILDDALREASMHPATPTPIYEEPETVGDDSTESQGNFSYSHSSFRASEPPDDISGQQGFSNTDVDADEAAHIAQLEESRKKLQELEKDRPLWEEAQRQRQAEEERLAAEQARAKKAKAKEEQTQREESERRRTRQSVRQEEDESARKEAARREYINGQKERLHYSRRTFLKRWSVRDALQRYLECSADFDAAKFGKTGQPPTFETIPWPSVIKPDRMTLEDVSWEGVEQFFESVQHLVTPEEYKSIVLKSHRRFHPDKWSSRGVLSGIKDEVEKFCLETAAQAVAQALTPLWRAASGTD